LSEENQRTQNRNNSIKTLTSKLLGFTLLMFGFGFALVPLYDVFCDITGLNGKTAGRVDATELNNVVDTSRLVRVQFIANIGNGLPWQFHPLQTSMEVHPGQTYEAMFYTENSADHDVIGQAITSVSPGLAAEHFHKTECFCFTQQTLAAGEKRDMPLRFTIDPNLPKDIDEITLSYTFFPQKSG